VTDREQLLQLIERRNAVAKKRDNLLAEVKRMDTDIEAFDKEIMFADAVRVAADNV
jgi:hypothetical protein